MKKSYRKIIVIVLASLCSTSAYATTSYFSEAHLILEVTGFSDLFGNHYSFADKPSAINFSYFDNALDEEYIISITGNATADAITNPFSDAGQIDLYTSLSGDSSSHYALSVSDATAIGSFELENTSSSIDYTVNLLLSYFLNIEVEIDYPSESNAQIASVSTDFDVTGDFNLEHVLQLSEQTDLGHANFSGVTKLKEIQLSFLLPAGEVENVFAIIVNHGESESISAVPLPASIFFFGSALLALSIRKKKLEQ